MNEQRKNRLVALMAGIDTPGLATALRNLDARKNRTTEESTARVWMIDELERRHPSASAAVEAAFDAAEALDPPGTVDYVAVLLANTPA